MAIDGEPLTLTSAHDCVQVPSLEIRAETALEANGVRATTIPLGLIPVTVGKGAEAQLIVEDPKVSRLHCSFTLTTSGVRLRDLGSKNGTFVGGVQVNDAFVREGMIVTIGQTRIAIAVKGASSSVPLYRSPRFGDALGTTVIMRTLFAELAMAAATEETVLLLGESGTGKELLARAIHEHSPRKDGPFAIFDASAVAPQLVEAELFGYVRGAFTGAVDAKAGILEHASGGTLFLDEIGELPIDLQPKLLRALEARQFRRLGANTWQKLDARIVAATHRDLRAEVAAGKFRQDLFFRLAVLAMRVPPLRERKEDLDLLIESFLSAHHPPRSIQSLSPQVLAMLRSHDWPGNVRELRNILTRVVVFPHLGLEVLEEGEHGPSAAHAELPLHLPLRSAREQVVAAFERVYLTKKLEEHGGNVTRAADAMGVSRQFVHRMMDRYSVRR